MQATTDHTIQAELAKIGLRWANCLSWNETAPALLEKAVERGEGRQTATGGFSAVTGEHSGRAPKDKFIVRDESTADTVWWDNNAAMNRAQFDALKADMMLYARLKSLFVQDLVAGADPAHSLATRVITERAWHALFIRHLLRQPDGKKAFKPQLTIISLPTFKANPGKHGTHSQTVIALDLKNLVVLIGGTDYAGEIKKAVFTVLNYLLPARGILPMHCSANVGSNGDTAIFFGLSGTGKTTLSADPVRALIGDDEHGWSEDGVFNFEGGCYAKAINLTAASEPDIYRAALAPLTVLENVVLNDTGHPDFADISLTENTRAAYPLSAIANAQPDGKAASPRAIIMLTADAFGVLPPVARLTPAQAMDHFLSGYTAKVAGTEKGVCEPQATFSACFGAPFLPRHPSVYGALLRDLIARHQVPVYLVNTGWSGGGYGVGKRMPLAVTRRIVTAALTGELENVPVRSDANFGFAVPVVIDGVPGQLLDPRATWANPLAYDQAAVKLVELFAANYRKFGESELLEPATRIAAE